MTESSIDALQATLVAQGIDPAADPLDTLGRSLPFADALSSLGGLPEARMGTTGDQDLILVSELGRGGMGVVFLAKQRALEREVAVKRCGPEGDAVQALVREARIMGSLEHPNVIPVHALLADGDGPAVVMKRVAGVSWDESLGFRTVSIGTVSMGAVSIDRHLEIFLQLCNAVAYAHSRGVIHRDIKPANVLLGEYGEVYLADWGLARRLEEGPSNRIAGSPAYMAPEMLGGAADERTDIYLLGATLHRILTGEPRHRGSLPEALDSVQRSERHAYPMNVPADLAAVCNRACAADPADRFQRAVDLRAAVRAHLRLRAMVSLVSTADTRRAALAAASDDPSRSNQLFTEARFGYEQAIEELEAAVDGADTTVRDALATQLERAVEGREQLLATMARIELERRQPDAALGLLRSMRTPDAALVDRAEALREQLEIDRARLSRFEEDVDPAVGAGARSWAQLILAGAILILTLLFAVVFAPRRDPSPTRLAIVGAVVFAVIASVVAVWSRRGKWNLVNRRIAQIAVLASAVSALQRVVAIATGADAPHVLLTDAFVLGMAGVALTPFHRAGWVLAALSAAIVGVGLVDGSLIDETFVGLSVGVPVVLFAGRFLRRGRTKSG